MYNDNRAHRSARDDWACPTPSCHWMGVSLLVLHPPIGSEGCPWRMSRCLKVDCWGNVPPTTAPWTWPGGGRAGTSCSPLVASCPSPRRPAPVWMGGGAVTMWWVHPVFTTSRDHTTLITIIQYLNNISLKILLWNATRSQLSKGIFNG